MAFEGTGNAVKAKLGPFPVWVWGLIIGGAFVVWYWVSQGGGGSGESVEESTDDGTAAPPSGDFSTVPIVPTTPGDSAQDEATNAEWLIQAVEAASQSGVSFVGAQTALMKYLNGQTLTDAERKIIDSAIARVGLPPEGVASTPDVTPPPEETPEPTPTAPSPIDYATVTTFSVPSKAKYGQTIAIRMNVRWKNSGGKAPLPTAGTFVLMVGNQKYRKNDIAGSAIQVIRLKKGDKRLAGNRAVVYARYEVPSGKGYKTRGSQAAPKTIILS